MPADGPVNMVKIRVSVEPRLLGPGDRMWDALIVHEGRKGPLHRERDPFFAVEKSGADLFGSPLMWPGRALRTVSRTIRRADREGRRCWCFVWVGAR